MMKKYQCARCDEESTIKEWNESTSKENDDYIVELKQEPEWKSERCTYNCPKCELESAGYELYKTEINT